MTPAKVVGSLLFWEKNSARTFGELEFAWIWAIKERFELLDLIALELGRGCCCLGRIEFLAQSGQEGLSWEFESFQLIFSIPSMRENRLDIEIGVIYSPCTSCDQ